MRLRHHALVQSLDDAVHLPLLGDHIGTETGSISCVHTACGPNLPARPSLVTNVIQTKVMKDHETPIIILEFSSDIASDVVVYLGEVLEELHVSMTWLRT